jgi:hypothetical protein
LVGNGAGLVALAESKMCLVYGFLVSDIVAFWMVTIISEELFAPAIAAVLHMQATLPYKMLLSLTEHNDIRTQKITV